MPAITLTQLRALLEGAPGDARIEAVRASKRSVAEDQRAVAQRIDDTRASHRSPPESDLMLLGSLEEATRLLGELEFALATGIEADQAACLERVTSLLERLTRLATPMGAASK